MNESAANNWKPFWLGVNATAAGGWAGLSAFELVEIFRGSVAASISATLVTGSLLLGVAWLVAGIRSVRAAGPSAAAGLFWFAVSTTLGAGLALLSAIQLDLARRIETTDAGALTGLAVGIACGLIWFAISVWGAAALVSRLKGKRY